jgi:hypothetical protein
MSVYPHQVGAVDQWRVRLNTVHKQAVMIVSLLAMSVVVYTVIGFVLTQSSSGSPSDMRAPFLIAALALSFASIGLRRVMLGRTRLESVAASRGLNGVIGYIFNMTIISSAIGETIGILALTVSFLGGQQTDVLILGAIGLMIVLSNYPRRAAWTNTLEYLAAELPKEYHER